VPTDIAALLLVSICFDPALHGLLPPFASVGLLQIVVPLLMLCGAGLYSTDIIHPAVELRKLTGAMALAAIILAISGPDPLTIRALLIAVLGFSLRALFLTLARTILHSVMNRTGLGLRHTLIIGSGALPQQVFQTIEKHRHLGLKAVAVLDDPGSEPEAGR